MANTSEDQWSFSYIGDDSSRIVDISDTSAGGRLRLLCSGDLDLAIQAAEGNSQIIEELELWEKQFPSLVVKGTKISIQKLNSISDATTVGTRMMIARRIVLHYLLPDVGYYLETFFIYHFRSKNSSKQNSLIPTLYPS